MSVLKTLAANHFFIENEKITFQSFQYEMRTLYLFPFMFDELGVRLIGLRRLWFPIEDPGLRARAGGPANARVRIGGTISSFQPLETRPSSRGAAGPQRAETTRRNGGLILGEWKKMLLLSKFSRSDLEMSDKMSEYF